MKIIIFVFSGTGNTWFVAQCLQENLKAGGAFCDVISVETINQCQQQIETADIIGIGYPIYGSDMPEPITTFIKKMENHPNKRAFVYCTQMMYSGDGASIGGKLLRQKGFDVRQLAHFNMPNNKTDYPIFKWMKPPDYDRLKKRIMRKTKRFATAILTNKRKRKGDHLFGLLLGLLQRIPYRHEYQSFKNTIKIDQTCIGCSHCTELCPSGNLVMEDGVAKGLDKCVLCYRCVNHCPVNAIHFAKKSRVITPYHGPTKDFDIEQLRKTRID